MARNNSGKVSSKSTKPPMEPVAENNLVKLVPDLTTAPAVLYANYATISHSQNDLCIDFCVNVPPHKVKDVGDTTVVYLPMVARIIIPPEMAEGLAEALNTRKNKFEADREEGRLALVVQEVTSDG